MKIIVLETFGKMGIVYGVKIKLFDTTQEAENYCKLTTNNPKEEKWWRLCEIIEENIEYEI